MKKNKEGRNMQSRWKSPVFWGSVIVAIASILAMFGVFTEDMAAKISGAVATLLAVIVGAANNPTDKNHF